MTTEKVAERIVASRHVLAVGSMVLLVALALFGQGDLPRANTVVKPKALVSMQPAPRGSSVEVAVVAEILKGFHVNSNKPKEDYLIPTTLTPEIPAGLKVVETTYPQGKTQKFEFSETPLDVYDGTVIIRMKLQVAGDAPIGPLPIPMTLRYQACNDRACLPPVKLPVTADLQIAAAGAKAVAQHPNVFPKTKSK